MLKTLVQVVLHQTEATLPSLVLMYAVERVAAAVAAVLSEDIAVDTSAAVAEAVAVAVAVVVAVALVAIAAAVAVLRPSMVH